MDNCDIFCAHMDGPCICRAGTDAVHHGHIAPIGARLRRTAAGEDRGACAHAVLGLVGVRYSHVDTVG